MFMTRAVDSFTLFRVVLSLIIVASLLLPIGLPFDAATQSEGLAARAVSYLKQGKLDLAAQLAKDAIEQSTSLDDVARATITLSLIDAKRGDVQSGQARLKRLLSSIPQTNPYYANASKALALLSSGGSLMASTSQVPPSVSSSTADYFDYAITPGQVTHWNLTGMPMKIYIESDANASRLGSNYKQTVLNAMSEWRKAVPELRFKQVFNEDESDVRVTWKKTIQHNRIGESPSIIIGGKLVLSDLVLATHTPSGQPMSSEMVYETAIHEFGHVLGIHGHSPNADDTMYWQASTTQRGLTPRDLSTMRRLYSSVPDFTNDPSVSMAQSRRQGEAVYAAQSLYQKNDYAGALRLLAATLAERNNYTAHKLAALCYSALSDVDNAIVHYGQSVKLDQHEPKMSYNLAVMHLKRADKLGMKHPKYRTDVQTALTIFKNIQTKIEPEFRANVALGIRECEQALSAIANR